MDGAQHPVRHRPAPPLRLRPPGRRGSPARWPRAPPGRGCHRGRRPAPCRDGRRRPARPAPAAELHQLDGVEARRQIVGDADHQRGAILAAGHQRHDAGADLLLQLVGHALQLLRRHAVEQPGGELDAAHILVPAAIFAPSAAGRQALARLGQARAPARLRSSTRPAMRCGSSAGWTLQCRRGLADQRVPARRHRLRRPRRSAPRCGARRRRPRLRRRS